MKCQMKIYMFLPNCCCTCEIVTALVSHGSLTSLSAPPWLGLDAVGFKDDDDYLTSAPMELMSTEYNDEWKVTLWISLCLDWILLNIYSNALVLRAQIELMQNKSNISTLMFIQGHWSGRQNLPKNEMCEAQAIFSGVAILHRGSPKDGMRQCSLVQKRQWGNEAFTLRVILGNNGHRCITKAFASIFSQCAGDYKAITVMWWFPIHFFTMTYFL